MVFSLDETGGRPVVNYLYPEQNAYVQIYTLEKVCYIKLRLSVRYIAIFRSVNRQGICCLLLNPL